MGPTIHFFIPKAEMKGSRKSKRFARNLPKAETRLLTISTGLSKGPNQRFFNPKNMECLDNELIPIFHLSTLRISGHLRNKLQSNKVTEVGLNHLTRQQKWVINCTLIDNFEEITITTMTKKDH